MGKRVFIRTVILVSLLVLGVTISPGATCPTNLKTQAAE